MTFSDEVTLTYDGVGVYARALPLNFEANATIYAGQAVKITGGDEKVGPASAVTDIGIGIAAFDASSGDQVGVYPPGSIVYGAIIGSCSRGDLLVPGQSGSTSGYLSSASFHRVSGSATHYGVSGYRPMAMALETNSGYGTTKLFLL